MLNNDFFNHWQDWLMVIGYSSVVILLTGIVLFSGNRDRK